MPRAPFVVVPAELADEGVFAKLRHRVVVRHWITPRLHRDGPPLREVATEAGPDADDILPVIDETPHLIRIVVEDDSARFAAWIEREHAAHTVIVPTKLIDRSGVSHGVWLEPGVALAAKRAERGARSIVVRDDELAIAGEAQAAHVGHVWVVPAGAREVPSMKPGRRVWMMPLDREPYVRLAPHTEVRARAAAVGAVLASVKDEEHVAIRIGAARGGWTEVELLRPHIRVRGFVIDAAVLGPSEAGGTTMGGKGHGYGSSHAQRFELPAGTCLYDGPEGEVIGVQLTAMTRLGEVMEERAWAMVYVGTPWSALGMFVKNVGSDPPVWDACTQRAHP